MPLVGKGKTLIMPLTPPSQRVWRRKEGTAMSDIESVKALIIESAADGIDAVELHRRLMQADVSLGEAEVQTILLALQEEGRLIGQEVEGQWRYTRFDNNDAANAALEYSPQFAERILAASCDEFVEIDVDDMIQMLDDMLAQARSRRTDTK